jgi:hypothetical protein
MMIWDETNSFIEIQAIENRSLAPTTSAPLPRMLSTPDGVIIEIPATPRPKRKKGCRNSWRTSCPCSL